MTTSYLSISEFTGDGVTTEWDFNFAGGYISRDHVFAYTQSADGVVTHHELTFVSDFRVVVTPAVPVGDTLRIYRNTPREEPIVNFTGGSNFTEANLDLLARQTVFVAAEAFDAGSYAYVNDLLAAATNAQSASAASALEALAAAEDSHAAATESAELVAPALASKFASMMIPRGEWAAATAYLASGGVRDTFTKDGVAYVVVQDHTAGVFADDLAAGKFFQNDAAQLGIDLQSADAGKGGALAGFSWANLPLEINKIDWALQVVGAGVNILRYIPPAEWAAIFAGTSTLNTLPFFDAALAAHDDVYVPAGKYNITGPLVVPAEKGLSGVGKKSIIYAVSVSGAALSLESGAYAGATEGGSIKSLRISGSATKGLHVKEHINCSVDNISLDGLTATDGFVFESTWGSSFSNLWTNGAAISNACFTCGMDFNANDSRNWYTSNFSTYNVLIDGKYNGGHGASHGSKWSMITVQGGVYGLFIKHYQTAIVSGLYSENVVHPLVFGDIASLSLAVGCTVDGGDFGGPAAWHPQNADKSAAVIFDYAHGCHVGTGDFSGAFGCGKAAVVTISGGGGTGAKAQALVSATGSVLNVTVLTPGSGYTSDPVATVSGAGSGATLTITRSGTTVSSVAVSAAGSGYVPTALPAAIAYRNSARCSVGSSYFNSGNSLFSPLYPFVVRLSGASSTSGVTLLNDLSLRKDFIGTNAELRKARGYGYVHTLIEYDASGALASTPYVPPLFP